MSRSELLGNFRHNLDIGLAAGTRAARAVRSGKSCTEGDTACSPGLRSAESPAGRLPRTSAPRRHARAKHSHVEPQAFAHEQLPSDEAALDRVAVFGRALAQAGDVTPKKLMIVPMSGTAALDWYASVRCDGDAALDRRTSVATVSSGSRESAGAECGSTGRW